MIPRDEIDVPICSLFSFPFLHQPSTHTSFTTQSEATDDHSKTHSTYPRAWKLAVEPPSNMTANVNKPTDVKQKEADINRKLQVYGIFSAFKEGKVPSVCNHATSSTNG